MQIKSFCVNSFVMPFHKIDCNFNCYSLSLAFSLSHSFLCKPGFRPNCAKWHLLLPLSINVICTSGQPLT